MTNHKEALELVQKLISIKSPYFEEDRIMEFVDNWFRNNGMNPRIHRYCEEKVTGFKGENVILELEGSKPGPVICINGHLDTVKLCGGWTVDPYAGYVDGDRVYGVGALDMKSGCAATMLALKTFTENHKEDFKGKIISTYVSSEEGPYGMGTNALIEEGYLKNVDFSIVTEPSAGFVGKPFPTVCLGARGGYGLEIEFFGKSAHAALPKSGKSAALDAAKVVCELEKVDYIEDAHLGTGAACVVAIESDGGACSVPDYARVKLFWHIVVGENEETIVREIEKAIRRAGIQCDYTINFREAPSEGSKGFMPYIVEESNPYVKSFIDSVVSVCGEEPEIAYFQSIGDFNYLGTRLGAPVVLFGAEGENFHSHDEYATVSSIVKTTEVIYDFLRKQLV
ncbi:MAG: M20/M25/M40 family metallo-hydrolase [Bacillota bacterium]|nr:M20/M25/M40 family metallo-hydrolase [Bacillota bacterium]NLM08867.1 M20 family metallopeptidase [Clostridiales Family XIII bacterium]